LEAFTVNMAPQRLDSMDFKLEKEVERYEPVVDSPLQKELNRMRSVMQEEREEKALRLSSASSMDEEYEDFNKQDEELCHQYVNTRTSYRYSNTEQQWNEEKIP